MKFLGVGLSTAIGLSIFTMVMIIMIKTVANKYDNPATEIINTI